MKTILKIIAVITVVVSAFVAIKLALEAIGVKTVTYVPVEE